MILSIISVMVLLGIVGIAVLVLGKNAIRTSVSEFWKPFFAIVLFALSNGGLSSVEPTVRWPFAGMFAFACFLTIWFVVSFTADWRKGNQRHAE